MPHPCPTEGVPEDAQQPAQPHRTTVVLCPTGTTRNGRIRHQRRNSGVCGTFVASVPHGRPTVSSCHIRTSVLPSGDRRYVVRYRTAGRGTAVQHAGSFGTMREAKIRQGLVLDWLAGGKDPRVELERLATETLPGTLGDLADRWLASRHGIADSTRETYGGYIRLMKRQWPTVDPERLTAFDVSRWVGALVAGGAKPGTVKGYVRTLRMILDGLDVNVARHRSVELPRQQRREPEPPDADDLVALLGQTPARYVVATVFLEQTGARVSEAIGVAERDVEAGRVRFRADESKGDRSRWVDCPGWLLQRMPLRGVERTALGNSMRRASGRAMIGNVYPHLLRHRRATLWHQSGLPAVELAYRLGHARPSMSLDVYSHVRRLHEVDQSVLQVVVEELLDV